MDTGGQLVGACADYDNTELWFPEMGRGSGGEEKAQAKAQEVNLAIDICKSCDIKEQCLEEGMKPENLYYGIWGGLLAYERILNAGIDVNSYHPRSEPGMARKFYDRMKPYLRR